MNKDYTDQELNENRLFLTQHLKQSYMEIVSNTIGRKSKAASILVHVQPVLLVLSILAAIIQIIVLSARNLQAAELGAGAYFIFNAWFYILVLGVFTGAVTLIVCATSEGCSKPYVSKFAAIQIVVGILPLLFAILLFVATLSF